jgi:hypothetical protein
MRLFLRMKSNAFLSSEPINEVYPTMSENIMAANLRFAMVFCGIKKSARG